MRNRISLLLIILAGVILRLIILDTVLRGDVAVFGLMAKHISELKEFPVYLWKAHYAGTLGAYIAAIFFRIFGISALTYKITGFLFAVLFIFVVYLSARKIIGEEFSLLSALFISISPVFVTSFSIMVTGVYAEGFLFQALILFLILMFLFPENTDKKDTYLLILLGLLNGFGVYHSPQVIPFFISSLVFIWVKDKKIFFSRKIILFFAPFFIGYLPAIIYNFKHPTASLFRFGGRILNLDRTVLSEPDILRIVFLRIIWRLSTIPVSLSRIPNLLLPLMGWEKNFPEILFPVVMVIYWGTFFYVIFNRRRFFQMLIKGKLRKVELKPLDVCIVFSIIFIIFYITLVGENRSRYLLPLYMFISIFLSCFLRAIKKRKKILYFFLLSMILGLNLLSNFRARKVEPYSYPDIVSFLSRRRIFYGYSEYFTAYPVVFASKESIIISPCVFDDYSERYPLYTEMVNSRKEVAIIFNNDSHPDAARILEQYLKREMVEYKKAVLSPFSIYYNFSRRICLKEVDWKK